jgi:hypothetical protein
MVRLLTHLPSEGALEATVRADHEERDRKAWNTPRAPVTTGSKTRHRDGLNWDEFRDLYYPNSRRHTFGAIAAYGDYKRSSSVPEAEVPSQMSDAKSTGAPSLEEWEAEGGTTLPAQ